MAFKVFNNREAEAEAARQARLQQKVALQTQAMLAALRPEANTGAGGAGSLSLGQRTPHQGPVSSVAKRDTGPASVLNPGHQRSPAPIADSLATGGIPVPLEARSRHLHTGDQPIKVWTLTWPHRNFSDF